MFFQLFTTGTVTRSALETRTLDIVAMLPAVLGVVAGIVVVTGGGKLRLSERVALTIGMLGCGLAIFSFGWEALH